ncbi:MAG: hypothetical protein V4723_20300 [Pseudomonadota bacterium]
MPHRIVQPTKEQVRAYMAAREAARRPPPAPEEIRRLLGWRLETAEADCLLLKFYLIPTNYAHFAACLTLDWLSAWMPNAPFSLGNPALICKKPTQGECENLTA